MPTNEQLNSPMHYDKINSSSLVNTDKGKNDEIKHSLKNSEDS